VQTIAPTDPPGILFVIGAALVLAFLGAAIMKKVGVPQILGFMLAGLILGSFPVFMAVFDNLQPLVELALGLIGYSIGLEIRKDVVKGRTRQLGAILAFESILTFALVAFITLLIIDNWAIALVFGGLASATDPVSTVMVIWERRCKGKMTDTLIFVLGMDDVVAIVLSNIAISIVIFYYAPSTISLIGFIVEVLRYLGLATVIGALFGIGMVYFINRESDRTILLEFELGLILFLVGLMVYLRSSSILACMVFGFIVCNYVQPEKEPICHRLKVIMTPVVMIFFVIVGASPNFGNILAISGVLVVSLVIAYILGRTIAKYTGAYIGARITDALPTTTKYLGFCLMSQAGVAVGLALVAEYELKRIGLEAAAFAGEIILSVIILTTIVLQILGPIAANEALKRSGESSLDLTDNDDKSGLTSLSD
jgi:Kef-type K+ transport system membrane component KefB